MTKLRNKIEYALKYSIISIIFVVGLQTEVMAEEKQKFNFGFDRMESILTDKTFNWTAFNSHTQLTEKKFVPHKQDTTALSALKRFAAMSASMLVEFTSDDTFNEIELN